MRLLASAAALLLAASARAGSVAAPERGAPPLGHAAALMSAAPDLGAGAAYLADPRARLWMDANRSDVAPALTARALSFEDWRQTLSGFDHPRKLREALLAPGREELAQQPERTLAMTGHDGERALLEKALLEWRTLEEPVVRRIEEAGVTETEWQGWPLKHRLQVARRFAEQYAEQLLDAADGAGDYAGASQEALRVLGPLSTDEELDARTRRFEQAQRVAAELGEDAQAVKSWAGDAQAQTDPGAGLGFGPASMTRFTKALRAQLLNELSAAPGGAELAAFYQRSGLSIEIVPMGRHSLGQYDPRSGSVRLSEQALVEALEALGRKPRVLLRNGRALRELAMALAPLLVHEAIHQRQFEDAADRGLTVEDAIAFYNHDWELEAFTAQTAYVESRRRSDPAFAALVERMKASDALDSLLPWDDLLSRPSEFADLVRSHYRRQPTAEGGAARLIKRAFALEPGWRRDAHAISTELGRRRRLAPIERLAKEWAADQDPVDIGPAAVSGIATSRLRELHGQSERMIGDMTATALSLMQLTRQRLADARARLDAALKP